MEATAKALAPDPLQSVHVDLLTHTLDSGKILLSKVTLIFFNLKIASPEYSKGKSRTLILAGTTLKKMGIDYCRTQRPSIKHPATIGDIPFEVIKKAFLLLGREDLVSASLSCRAWRQAGVEPLVSYKYFDNQREIERFFCGMQLKKIVFGFDQYTIKQLDLIMLRVGIEYARVLADAAAHTLTSLRIDSAVAAMFVVFILS
jgi:hypothetical protein